MLNFRGIQKTTLADYPGEVACTLFLGGCNWRCFFCYNAPLVFNQETGVKITADEALGFLKERQGFLDGVCITGGEPLLQYAALAPFLRQVKALGYKIKLDTNGSCPDELANLLQLLDYVAMDIKAPPEKYQEVVGLGIEINQVKESVRLLINSGVDYEFRTTAAKNLTAADFLAIGEWLNGAKRYFLQPMKTDLPLLDPDRRPEAYSTAELLAIAAGLKGQIRQVEVRG